MRASNRTTTALACVGALAVAAAIPSSAFASSDLFASPAGKATGDCHFKADPCSLSHALDRASTRDTVNLLAGRYSVAAGLWPQQSVNLVGAPGAMPVVDFGTFTMSQIKAAHPAAAGALDLYGSNLRNIKFIGASDDAPILNFDDSTAGTLDNSSIRAYIDRIVVEGSGSAIPVELMGGLRNSIVTASDSAYALEGVGSVIGSTILNRTPAAAAIRVRQTREPSGLEQLHNSLYVRNSIIRGTGSEDNILTLGPAVDVDWTNVNPGGRVAFSLPPIEAPVSVGSHITTLEPGFVSATDLHLQPTSPLIDAGATAVTLGLVNLSEVTAADLGSLDAFGARRLRAGNSGGAVAQPDIGAAEYQPPSPAVSAVRVASRKVRAGGTNSVSMRVSAAANLLVLVQRVQGKRVTTIATRRVKAGVGPVVARFTLRSGRKKFAKGQYRFAISPTSIDGVAGSAVYLPFKIV